MTLSLAARLTAAFILVFLVLTAGSVVLTGMSLRSRMTAGLASSLEQDEAAWNALQEQEERALVAVARAASAGPVLRAELTRGVAEVKALQAQARAQRDLLGVDVLLLAGADGALLAGSRDGAVTGLGQLLRREGLALITFAGEPYQAVSQAVEEGGRTVGHVVVGTQLGSALLRRLHQQRAGVEPVLHLGPRLVAHAFTSGAPEALLGTLPAQASASVSELELAGVPLRVSRVAVGDGIELVLARSAKLELARLRSTLGLIVLLGCVTAAIAGVVIFLLVRRVMAPLSALREAAARVVAEGDFSRTLDVRSTGEIGQLAASFAEMMARLRSVLLALRGSAQELEATALELATSASEQNLAVTRQAAALHQTQIAAKNLQQSSRAAAQRATGVLREAEQAGALGQAGESALAGSVGGLTHIRSHVDRIFNTVTGLQQRTRQVGDITGTVKDLADQSNVLALNAAIEAARSGESGRAFAVVARQMRSLADQSASATARVQTILADIGKAISETVRTSEGGSREVEGGLEQVRAAGESLRALATLIQNNSQAVRSIAETVSQQDAGIAELFAALSDLTTLADETVERVATSAVAAARLTSASHDVSSIVNQYRL
ncbi:methyl-accepting chemotaxis protein [Corallococcus sp. H22C18031201]|nr:methyl-accepting chemotaxis protein [Corallococcus sp. H22C18031201]